MKKERNRLCPCGSGKKYKNCCWSSKHGSSEDISDPDTIELSGDAEFRFEISEDDDIADAKEPNKRTATVSTPLTNEAFPLEVLKHLIEKGMIQDEIPFKILATEYPSLLEDWYPGFPGMPRMMTPEDPMCVVGHIENGMISFKDMGIDNIPMETNNHPQLNGEHKVWLIRENDSWFVHVVVNECTVG